MRPNNVLSIALGAAPASLDPVKSTDATGMRMVSLIYQGLVQIGPDLQPQPDLAYEWTIEKAQNYTFMIKDSLKFSDGQALTCESLKGSILAFQDSKSPFSSVFKEITQVDCNKETSSQSLKLSFRLKKPSVKFLTADLPVLKIMSPKKLGSGAFQVTKNSPSESHLAPNAFFPDLQKYTLVFKYLKDDFSRFLKIYKGEIDIAPNSIPFEKVASFGDSTFQVIEEPSLSTSYLLINHRNPALQNLDFRKHLLKSIEVDDLIENRFENHVTKAYTLLSPQHPYFPKEAPQINLEPKESKFKKALLTLKSSNSRQARETSKIISQKLRASGVPMRVHSYEWGTFYKDIKSGNFDIALMKWVGVVDPDLYNLAFHSSEFPPGRNRGFYKSTQLDSKLDQARTTQDLQERILTYSQIQMDVLNKLAIIPLWHENQIHIIHPRVQNYTVHPMGNFSSFLNLKVN